MEASLLNIKDSTSQDKQRDFYRAQLSRARTVPVLDQLDSTVRVRARNVPLHFSITYLLTYLLHGAGSFLRS